MISLKCHVYYDKQREGLLENPFPLVLVRQGCRSQVRSVRDWLALAVDFVGTKGQGKPPSLQGKYQISYHVTNLQGESPQLSKWHLVDDEKLK